MRRKRKPTIGEEIIRDLKDVLAGKPVRQTIMRRMTVKGRTVYTRESFVAPIRPPSEGAGRDGAGQVMG